MMLKLTFMAHFPWQIPISGVNLLNLHNPKSAAIINVEETEAEIMT